MKYIQYITSKKDNLFLKKIKEGEFTKYDDSLPDIKDGGSHPFDIEGNQIKLYPSTIYQTFKGIGGALTESSAAALFSLPKEEQDKVIKGYFSKEGIRYSLARTHIGSCDFSLKPYSYIKDNNIDLTSFSLGVETNTVTKLLGEALKENKDLFIFSSPWSQPPFMKTNNNYCGGKLKEECYDLWARYVAKYIEEYRKLNINIQAVTVQNEPRHHQLWESTTYTKEEEIKLVNKSLKKELSKLNTKIFVYDHCGERLFERANYAFNNSKVDGIAFHWYSGDYFNELKLVRELYKDKDIIMSEGCASVPYKEYSLINNDTHWSIAFKYSRMICEYFNHGLNYFCDWNICLNEYFGPSHFRENRPCEAYSPVICDSVNQKAIFTPTFYAIGQYSKFVDIDASIIANSSAFSNLNIVAFKNLDNSIVLVIHNESNKDEDAIINVDNMIARVGIKALSISTFIIK